MAKMFYSLEEAAAKLSVAEDEIRSMVSSGQIQEFRDGERLLFKVEQIDLLAGGEEEEDIIPLAGHDPDEDVLGVADAPEDDSEIGFALADSPTESDPSQASGVSVFDADDLETADPSALTQISASADAEELNFETVGSGSGLLDLTRESDDTSLGAELLDEIYPGSDDAPDVPASASGLFESPGEEGGEVAAMPAGAHMAMAEPFDGFWSGASAGLLFGAAVALVVGGIVIGTAMISGAPALLPMIGKDMNSIMMYFGGLAGAMILFAIIGGMIGKKS
jgi:hypothetical protein